MSMPPRTAVSQPSQSFILIVPLVLARVDNGTRPLPVLGIDIFLVVSAPPAGHFSVTINQFFLLPKM